MGKILIIEDDSLVARMYEKVMKFEGMKVSIANDGKEGIQKAKEEKPDLVFCDIMMPQMNGIEVLEHLKTDPETQNIPVVMLTNLSGTHDAETALKKGALAYMVKSEYKPKEIASRAKEFLAPQEAAAAQAVVAAATGQAPTTQATQPKAAAAPAKPKAASDK